MTKEIETLATMYYYLNKYIETKNALYLSESKKYKRECDAILARINLPHANKNNSQNSIDWSG